MVSFFLKTNKQILIGTSDMGQIVLQDNGTGVFFFFKNGVVNV